MFSIGKQLVAMTALPFATSAMATPTPVSAVENVTALHNTATAQSVPVIVNAPAAPPVLLSLAAPAFLAGHVDTMLADASVSWNAPAQAPASAPAATAELDSELECMAKVVLHEAGHQNRQGQLAVAQVIMNRIDSGRFASTICGVANQPGQFFRTSSYNPDRSSAGWANAVAVARQVRDGSAEEVAPGALFFHAAYASRGSFFQGRQRVATLGGNVFYR